MCSDNALDSDNPLEHVGLHLINHNNFQQNKLTKINHLKLYIGCFMEAYYGFLMIIVIYFAIYCALTAKMLCK